MTSLYEKIFTAGVRRSVLLVLVGIILLLLISALLPPQKGFRSAELKFTDASSGGLAIVPASCPSYPYHATEVSGSGCSGNDVYVQYGDCSVVVTRTCGWQCSAGACVTPPPPEFVVFTGALPGDGGSFDASGHLEVKPILVRSGGTVRVYWNVTNVSNCSITGTNGDSWNALSSGPSGELSQSQIISQTIYTLTCNPLPEAASPIITETVTVNVLPVFCESGASGCGVSN